MNGKQFVIRMIRGGKPLRFDFLRAIGRLILPEYRFKWFHMGWWENKQFNDFLRRFDELKMPNTERRWMLYQLTRLVKNVPGDTAECGAYRGAGSYLICNANAENQLHQRTHYVFDSFEGMPSNAEAGGKSIYGREHHFPKGSHAVPFEEVKGNVARWGDASRVHYHKGFFSDTMPLFHEAVGAACVNVDLAQSTRDCFRYLWPLLPPGGIIISQDAHFPWIIELLRDDAFWRDELRVAARPDIPGLGTLKFVTVRK